jgi:D-amino-acid dehydrogenase
MRGPTRTPGGLLSMRIAVIGAGMVGTTTAFELALDGHEVAVYERLSGIAADASFAPGGLQAPTALAGWGPEWLTQRARPRWRQAVVGLSQAMHLPGSAGWLWQRWRASAANSASATRWAARQLAEASRSRALELSSKLALDYERHAGCLLLLRKPRDLAHTRSALGQLSAAGLVHALLDADQSRQIEPGLDPDAMLNASIHLPGDSVANSRHFAQLLKAEAQRLGAQFHFDLEVVDLHAGPPWQLQCRATSEVQRAKSPSDTQSCSADAVVLCTALAARQLMARLGDRLPVMAVHGYTITAPIQPRDDMTDPGPQAAVVDVAKQVQISRLGERVRVSGGATLGTPSPRSDRAAWDRLYRILDTWFPGAARISRAQEWRGARPTLPSGLPAIGATARPGLWVNTGHGDQGWAFACGSARLLADRLAGRQCEWDPQAFAPSRAGLGAPPPLPQATP